MFSKMVGVLQQLRGSVPGNLIDGMVKAFGKCSQKLTHRGDLDIEGPGELNLVDGAHMRVGTPWDKTRCASQLSTIYGSIHWCKLLTEYEEEENPVTKNTDYWCWARRCQNRMGKCENGDRFRLELIITDDSHVPSYDVGDMTIYANTYNGDWVCLEICCDATTTTTTPQLHPKSLSSYFAATFDWIYLTL